MYGNETIDNFFKVREAGFDYEQAADLTGVSISAGWQWSYGKFLQSPIAWLVKPKRVSLRA